MITWQQWSSKWGSWFNWRASHPSFRDAYDGRLGLERPSEGDVAKEIGKDELLFPGRTIGPGPETRYWNDPYRKALRARAGNELADNNTNERLV